MGGKHISILVQSTVTIADFVSTMKSNSSRWVHENFANRRGFACQEGYGAFSVSKSEEQRVIDYITNQKEHHRKRSFEEEYLAFLGKYGVEYDRRYLWN